MNFSVNTVFSQILSGVMTIITDTRMIIFTFLQITGTLLGQMKRKNGISNAETAKLYNDCLKK
jgi:hypothetical protein